MAGRHSFSELRARMTPEAQAKADAMAMVLGKAGTTDAVLPGDEIPEDWLEAQTKTVEPLAGIKPRD